MDIDDYRCTKCGGRSESCFCELNNATPELEESLKIIKFHDAICNESHTDGCGWLHEIIDGEHQWDLPSHKRWSSEYKRAKEINFEGYYKKIPYKE